MSSNIVICEENNIIALDIKKGLQKLGYHEPATLNCGEDLIEFVDNQIPQLIIMDIKLGGVIKGIDALLEIVKHHDIPIIILNGYRDTVHPEILDRKNILFISKPFGLKELEKAVSSLINPAA